LLRAIYLLVAAATIGHSRFAGPGGAENRPLALFAPRSAAVIMRANKQ
jgi:hypothetical protein